MLLYKKVLVNLKKVDEIFEFFERVYHIIKVKVKSDMNCANCNKELPAEWGFPCCPYCGATIVKQSQGQFNMGDANAIAGDLNIDSHNVINNKFVHIERIKSDGELRQDAKNKFKTLCETVYADGKVDIDESKSLESMRIELGLSPDEAIAIRNHVQRLKTSMTGNSLNPMAKMTLNNIVSLAKADKIDTLKQSFSRIEALHQKFEAEEVQFYYYLIKSSLWTDEFINDYEHRECDNYWQTFFAYLAYQRVKRSGDAEGILAQMEVWNDKPYGNMMLLAAVGCINEYWNDIEILDIKAQAMELIEQGSADCSELLERFTQALLLLCDDENIEDMNLYMHDFVFYFKYVFDMIIERRTKAMIYNIIPAIPKIAPLPFK